GTNQTYPADPAVFPAVAKDFVIPVYGALAPGPAVKVCGTNQFGTDHNKLGNYQFLRLTIDDAQAGDYDLTLALDTVPLVGDEGVGLSLYSRGTLLAQIEVETPAVGGTAQVSLAPGDYTVAVIDLRLTPCQFITLTKK
ncbi:MAG TPA: hypothetical protein VL024_10670, partial [Castellaniella sp.]|nr:hypothetical protein [Castellaniella sp.]